MTERLYFLFSLSCVGEGNGIPLQCSCLENPRDRGAWWASVYGVAQSRTRLKWLSSSSSSQGNDSASAIRDVYHLWRHRVSSVKSCFSSETWGSQIIMTPSVFGKAMYYILSIAWRRWTQLTLLDSTPWRTLRRVSLILSDGRIHLGTSSL